MKIKKSIRFNLDKRKGVEEDIRIRMRVSYDGKRINIPLSSRVSLEKWNDESELVLPKYEDKYGNTSKDINSEIEEHRSAMEKAFAKYELVEERIPTPQELKDEFNEIIGKRKKENIEEKPNVKQVVSIFLNENKDLWTSGTYRRMKSTLNHLVKFDDALEFSEINESLLDRYVSFLINTQNLQNSTAQINIKAVKWFLNWSIKNKYTNNTEHRGFKTNLKTTERKIVFLTWDELIRLYDLDIDKSKNYLERVRDVFCFQCFTSLRYSDVYNLKRADIKENTIEIVTIKTNDSIVIDLNDYSRAILNKYKGVKFPKGKALPVISNQKMNDYLKELGKLAGFDTEETIIYYRGTERVEYTIPKYELLSTHCGRRTFICNALTLGIPAHIVMKWTGHSDYRAMQPYIAVADKTKSKLMKKFNEHKE